VQLWPASGRVGRRVCEPIDAYREAGAYYDAARLLHERKVPTRKGRPWSGVTVRSFVDRTIDQNRQRTTGTRSGPHPSGRRIVRCTSGITGPDPSAGIGGPGPARSFDPPPCRRPCNGVQARHPSRRVAQRHPASVAYSGSEAGLWPHPPLPLRRDPVPAALPILPTRLEAMLGRVGVPCGNPRLGRRGISSSSGRPIIIANAVSPPHRVVTAHPSEAQWQGVLQGRGSRLLA
jgi:hypothetical protein